MFKLRGKAFAQEHVNEFVYPLVNLSMAFLQGLCKVSQININVPQAVVKYKRWQSGYEELFLYYLAP